MGKVALIVGLLLALAVLVVGVVVWWRKQYGRDKARERGWALDGDLNKRQETVLITQLQQAVLIFKSMQESETTVDVWTQPEMLTILSPQHKESVRVWLNQTKNITKNIKEVTNEQA